MTESSQRMEIEFLLICCRSEIGKEEGDRLDRLRQQNLDWEYLIELAEYHSVLPLLERQLQRFKFPELPTELLARTQTALRENLQYNLQLTAELIKLHRLFESKSIPMLSFKGAVLAQTAYGNVSLRKFLDLDVLIPESQIATAIQLLIAEGYTPFATLTDRQLAAYSKLRSEYTLWHEQKQVCVDLHWSILPLYYSFVPEPEILWQKIDRVAFADRSVTTLSRENLVLFLCAHGAKHNWMYLYWICDVDRVLRAHPDLNWDDVEKLAGKFGTDRMLNLGLYLARDLFATPLPPSILLRLESDLTLPSMADEVKQILFDRSVDLTKDDIYLKTMKSWRDRVWYWIDIICTPTVLELQTIVLPQALFPLYYLLRLTRLLLKYGLRLDIANVKE